jgi:TupA-like ATPgrasp
MKGWRPSNLARRVYRSPLVPDWVHDQRRTRQAKRDLLESISLPPVTFNEKIRYRMATDRRKILATFVDRIAVRQYVKDTIGEHLLSRVYAVTRYPERLLRSNLPREFVLKVSHGSGGMIFVGNHAHLNLRLPQEPVDWPRLHVHPERLDWDRLVNLSRHWLTLRYQPYHEWAYRHVIPRILIEELLVSDWDAPFEYKFYTFHGSVQFVNVPVDRFGDTRVDTYSRGWEHEDVRLGHPNGSPTAPPARLDEMIAVAERLSAGIDFVRVDLYDVDDRIVFGEMTVYPNAGVGEFDPPEFDEYLGSYWHWR